MSYEKQNFVDGQILTAAQLNHIEDGIIQIESELGNQGGATPSYQIRQWTNVTICTEGHDGFWTHYDGYRNFNVENGYFVIDGGDGQVMYITNDAYGYSQGIAIALTNVYARDLISDVDKDAFGFSGWSEAKVVYCKGYIVVTESSNNRITGTLYTIELAN